MARKDRQHRRTLEQIARRALLERGFAPDYGPEALAELDRIHEPAPAESGTRDLRQLAWCSIDNDDSLDLDQLTAAEPPGPDASIRIYVAVADVDALVPRGSAIDAHARKNTTSIYTPARIFAMLPEKLSTDLTSLNPDVPRLTLVIEAEVAADGGIRAADVYQALVENRAKLAYPEVAAWLDGTGPAPRALARVEGLAESLRVQDTAAQRLRARRHEQGALDLETIQVRARFEQDAVGELVPERGNRAKELIEDFMVAANGVVARYLAQKKLPSLRRVVRSPERWERIVDLAAALEEKLPPEPDAVSLERFLLRRRKADPVTFPDLSLSVIKLLGKGEYVVEAPGEEPTGHFGLAVRDYAHSTAPNRRYPDLLAHRLAKAALRGHASPYSKAELEELARHVTDREDAANKVERLVTKAAAALLLEDRLGEQFDGIVTGASRKGTWVRVFAPPVEGRVERGASGLDVGDRVRVELIRTDADRGYIDFARVR